MFNNVLQVFLPVLSAIVKEKLRKAVVETFEEQERANRQRDEGEEGEGERATDRRMDEIDRQGEAHESSDEEELPDDADATQARKKNRQADDGGDRGEEGLSDEEEEMVKELAHMLDEEGEQEKEQEHGEGSAPASADR